MEEEHIVYYHYVKNKKTKLGNTIVGAYSSAQAEYIVNKRLKKKGCIDYGVDSVMTIAKENAINNLRFYDL